MEGIGVGVACFVEEEGSLNDINVTYRVIF